MKPRADLEDGQPIVPPPGTFTVDDSAPKPVLYLPDGRVLVKRRPIGFRGGS